MEPHYIEERSRILQQQDCKQNESDMHIVTDYHLFIHTMYLTVATPTSPVQLPADALYNRLLMIQTAYQTESKHQLLSESDTVWQMYWDKDKQVLKLKEELRDKDRQVLRLKEELQAKQGGLTSLRSQFEQRDKEMLEQKGTQNQTGIRMMTMMIEHETTITTTP